MSARIIFPFVSRRRRHRRCLSDWSSDVCSSDLRSFTESFAAYRPAPDVTMARYIINEQLVRGINIMETMFYSATRPGGDQPAPPAPAASVPSQQPPAGSGIVASLGAAPPV